LVEVQIWSVVASGIVVREEKWRGEEKIKRKVK
jgi:hypothetical protein